MTQTAKGLNGTPQKQTRPGQRQQERLMRAERRRKRQRIWTASIVAVILVLAASIGFWQYQRYSAQIAADKSAKATAVALAHANASATAVTRDCFVAPAGTKTDNVYTATVTATPTAGLTTAPLVTGTPVKKSDGLQYLDIVVGTGPAAKSGSTVSVIYTGWLASNCQKFDSSYDHGGQSFDLALGKGQVIKGFDEGLVGMQKGGTRRISIPPALGYGSQAQQAIPADSTLIFDVTVVSVK
jgi:FKBP-type peptidyl-prolyl cis-trans isomerase